MRWAAAMCLLTLNTIAFGCTPSPNASGPQPADATRPGARPAPTPTTSTAPVASPPEAWIELIPGIRIERARRLVEFDGIVPINAHAKETPIVYLEAFVCAPDSKEHESLVMTRARPSNIHAALLAAGFEPGKPGSWTRTDQGLAAAPPSGDPIRVTFIVDVDGKTVESPASDWVKHVRTGERLAQASSAPWVFAGSRRIVRDAREWYDADGTGLIVGLHCFTSELVAWHAMLNPSAQAEEPVWIADASRVPRVGTPVRVRLGAAAPAE